MNLEEWRKREEMYACWLCNFPGIGNRQRHCLSELCGGPEAVYHADRDRWGKVLSPEQVKRLQEYTAKWRPEAEYRRMKDEGIDLVTVSHKQYPARLKCIPDPPYGLFFRGRLPAEGAPAVAVIGARECSEYGRYVAGHLGTVLGRNGVTVISGMAKGIDGISQEAALEAGGDSAGVLGCGVDICYPAQNKALYGRLARKGALLSEYPLGTPALPRNFPPRNRIVSGMADAVVVIEARARSGTLITVDMALEQGREVYVVPGRVTDRLSDGCNRLIKTGAEVLLDPESFLEEIRQIHERKVKRAPARKERGTDPSGRSRISVREGEEGRERSRGKENWGCSAVPDGLPRELAGIYGALDFYPKSTEEIAADLSDQYGEKEIITGLVRLCVEKLAVQVSPGHFCRKGEICT